MTINQLIAELNRLPQNAEVVLEDLNGLYWEIENRHIRQDENLIVIGSKDIAVD
jgi:hypothetical protein